MIPNKYASKSAENGKPWQSRASRVVVSPRKPQMHLIDVKLLSRVVPAPDRRRRALFTI